MKPGRRNLLFAGGIVGVIYGLRAVPWSQLPGQGPDYVAIDGLPPFRTLAAGGQLSNGPLPFIGLDPPDADATDRRARAQDVKADLCRALFGETPGANVLSIAYFSEFLCPFCRALERDLDAILADNPGIRLVQHELPIFGPPSELAARASVAAEQQGLQQPLRRRLMRTAIVADERSVLAVAATVGLDIDRLALDMRSDAVQAELDQTRALAVIFGFSGTPGLVIGRTVVFGSVSRPQLTQIIADERSMPPPEC